MRLIMTRVACAALGVVCPLLAGDPRLTWPNPVADLLPKPATAAWQALRAELLKMPSGIAQERRYTQWMTEQNMATRTALDTALDANRDGRIDHGAAAVLYPALVRRLEWERRAAVVRWILLRYDRDGDGRLSPVETAPIARMAATAAAPRNGLEFYLSRLEILDADGNGAQDILEGQASDELVRQCTGPKRDEHPPLDPVHLLPVIPYHPKRRLPDFPDFLALESP